MLAVRKLLQGSVSNVARLVSNIAVALVLPPLLVRRLAPAEYNAWVLVLQLTSYVNLLDLGLQGVLGKLFAENHARDDHESNHHLLSSAFVILAVIACAGLLLVAIMVWRVPQLFQQMPPNLTSQVRIGLAVMGIAAALSLPANPFVSTFTGLQEYGFPTVVAIASRMLSALAIAVLLFRHGSFLEITCSVGAVNFATATAQYVGWRRYVRDRIGFTFARLHRSASRLLLRTGGIIAVWTVGGLFVNGLDLLVVGHFDYAHTGAYSLAATATNFLLLPVTSLLSPLLPAVSAMQATGTPQDVGDVAVRSTRYCALLLFVFSLPLLIFAYPVLATWVGVAYAHQTVPFLEWLIVSNCIRQFAYPYSLIVIATGQQRVATFATVSEAIVNLAVSVWLVQRVGAVGVAYGTFAGALVSVSLHLLVSMPRTYAAVRLGPRQFFSQGLLRPLVCLLPLLFLLRTWRSGSMIPAPPAALAAWFVSTSALLYFVGLTAPERSWLAQRIRRAV